MTFILVHCNKNQKPKPFKNNEVNEAKCMARWWCSYSQEDNWRVKRRAQGTLVLLSWFLWPWSGSEGGVRGHDQVWCCRENYSLQPHGEEEGTLDSPCHSLTSNQGQTPNLSKRQNLVSSPPLQEWGWDEMKGLKWLCKYYMAAWLCGPAIFLLEDRVGLVGYIKKVKINTWNCILVCTH